MEQLDLTEVLLDPGKFFKTPAALMHYGAFTLDQKRKILKCWELDLKLLQVSNDENMGLARDVQLLSQIHEAIRVLEKDSK
jgi:hypothetical protein